MRRLVRITRFAVLAAAVSLSVFAQTPAREDAVIRSTTRLVEIHLAAWDDQRQRVTDLKREDFHVFDDGAERSIVSFTADGTPSHVRDPALRNNRDSGEQLDGYSAIVLDWLNSAAAGRLRGNDAVRKVLSTIPVHQEIGVYVLGMEPPNSKFPLTIVSDFGGSPADIARNIGDPIFLPGQEVEPEKRSLGAGRRISVEQQLFDWDIRIMDTVRGLSYLADRMARLPGRKSVIWLSDGFPMVIDGSVVPGAKPAELVYLKDLDRILAKFNQLNITVHTLNTQGLAATGRSYGDTLRILAERTGGTAFLDRNDLDTGVRIALEDMQEGYTLSFLVPDGARAGMHRIGIRGTRQNLKLSYREAYELSQ